MLLIGSDSSKVQNTGTPRLTARAMPHRKGFHLEAVLKKHAAGKVPLFQKIYEMTTLRTYS